MNEQDYVAVFEKAQDGSYSVYVPDLPGCTSSGDTLEEAERMIREAILAHVESLREHGDPIPPPTTHARIVHAA
ncbi:MAG: type II toxin-antitoxin system HicB family antitoxin [Phycisphaeraceae bacterium]|nr:type II toxin-antitoxin system HicB family antitoxin [Phycisphaeraceae bacterium]